MRVVINHLTRMDAPRICVAAIAPERGQHIRLISAAGDPLTRDLLAENGGPFALGTLVELGETTPTIKTDVVADVNARLQRGIQVLLMLGLARAFRRSEDDSERHWLQVNGICMADRPLGAEP
jgi:hypothetical protein